MASNQYITECLESCGKVFSMCGGIDYVDRYCYIIPPEIYNKNNLMDEDDSLHFIVKPCKDKYQK